MWFSPYPAESVLSVLYGRAPFRFSSPFSSLRVTCTMLIKGREANDFRLDGLLSTFSLLTIPLAVCVAFPVTPNCNVSPFSPRVNLSVPRHALSVYYTQTPHRLHEIWPTVVVYDTPPLSPSCHKSKESIFSSSSRTMAHTRMSMSPFHLKWLLILNTGS